MLTAEQQRLKLNVSMKRAPKPSKIFSRKKNKLDTPTIATIENIFLDYEISPAKYFMVAN